jgi:hypothetical protein
VLLLGVPVLQVMLLLHAALAAPARPWVQLRSLALHFQAAAAGVALLLAAAWPEMCSCSMLMGRQRSAIL